METSSALLSALVFAIAGLYSAVGHGGASGYIAVMTLLRHPDKQIATDALLLNVMVATIASLSYLRAKQLSWRLTWPFVITSVPASFVGGTLKVTDKVYGLLLAAVLIWSALRLFRFTAEEAGAQQSTAPEAGPGLPAEAPAKELKQTTALVSGALIGLVSGVVGVGGGIFLSPLMMLMKWADAKHVAGTSALFIVFNSLAGLMGRASSGTLTFDLQAPLLVSAFGGGLIGSYLGATKLPRTLFCKLLSIVLLIAAAKLIVTSVFPL